MKSWVSGRALLHRSLGPDVKSQLSSALLSSCDILSSYASAYHQDRHGNMRATADISSIFI